MPGFTGHTVPAWIEGALGEGLISVCVYGDNVRDARQLRELGEALRRTRSDALIAIDEEGGEVTRLHYRSGAPYPGAAVLGRIDDEAYTERVGAAVARDVLASGFNLVLGPDADVNSNPANPVIGTRSFGADPDLAARHVAAWVRGAQAAGVAACPKHFPGHGDTAQDSHLALPAVDAPSELIERRDLPPFRAAVEAGARAVMTSHILLPQIDAEAPATFSPAILQGMLRGGLGFSGAIVTDALDMAGASGESGIPEAAVRALAAGCDLLCIGIGTTPGQLREIEDRIAAAVSEGRLPETRVREAAARVRELAAALAGAAAANAALAGDAPAGAAQPGPAAASTAPVPSAPWGGTEELARIVASFDGVEPARRWLGEHPRAAVLRVEAEANMAVGAVPWGPFAAAVHAKTGESGAAARFLARPGTSTDEVSPMPWTLGLPADASSRGVIVIGRDLHRHEFAHDGIESLHDEGVPTLVVEMGWPDAERGLADVATHGASRLVGEALLALIEGPGL
ncbi:hypothetical protein JD276_10605 [Leucobacter sp. CSA1]|uniref:Glycoside hydrolase family 3 N-terminal domain-containing protein n=2 Tax=Leucobacter chromiisoli TaxID=2796471 RepID=A0A934Q855_9MICO|nr:hypothetical protein [Leucobacter chromiisoli]